MKIDSHVHAFTDSIAEKAVKNLSATAKTAPNTDGTVQDCRRALAECGVDYGVLLPIATKPHQQETINNWAADVNTGNIISFGTVHPGNPDWLTELERIKALGLKGVKLHPDYQGFFIFEQRLIPFWQRCAELDLPVTIHMGYDPVSPLTHRAMPQDLAYIHEKVPKVKIIAAHMGGMFMWEAAYEYICGDPFIWLDTAYTAGMLNESLMEQMIKKHGADRVLFASDLPWHKPTDEEEVLNRLNLTDGEKDKIFFKNAVELLKLNI